VTRRSCGLRAWLPTVLLSPRGRRHRHVHRDRIQGVLVLLVGDYLVLAMFARGLGWSLLGVASASAKALPRVRSAN